MEQTSARRHGPLLGGEHRVMADVTSLLLSPSPRLSAFPATVMIETYIVLVLIVMHGSNCDARLLFVASCMLVLPLVL